MIHERHLLRLMWMIHPVDRNTAMQNGQSVSFGMSSIRAVAPSRPSRCPPQSERSCPSVKQWKRKSVACKRQPCRASVPWCTSFASASSARVFVSDSVPSLLSVSSAISGGLVWFIINISKGVPRRSPDFLLLRESAGVAVVAGRSF